MKMVASIYYFAVLLVSINILIGHDNSVQGARILGIFPPPARSHYILASSLMRGLAEKGHHVTVISPYGEKNPPKNGTYKDITLRGVAEEMQALGKKMNMFDRQVRHPILMMPFIIGMSYAWTEKVFLDEGVQQLLKSDAKFDVIIVEQFMNEANKGLAVHFKAPLILFSTVGANSWFNPLVGNPQPLAYVPEVLLSYGSHMNFWQRLDNVVTWTFNMLLHHFYVYPKHRQLLAQHLPDVNFNEALYNSSLVLLNSHPSINDPVPYVPNMIDIGGFHVHAPKKLPQDLQEFMDGAKDGVIYFSLGSNLKSAQLPAQKRDALLKVFSKLKQRVLWKWEDDELPGKPANLKISKWFPQQDILAHPNVKIFFTHGGLLSTTETIYHGVPTLAMPLFADQKLNAQALVNNKVGLMITYQELNAEILESKLRELLNNPIYKENAKRRSTLFHDRLVSPMDTAAYWVDYVARHKGAPHLRVAALNLPWFQYQLLDVIAFLLLISTINLYLTYKFGKFVLRKICGKKQQSQTTKTKVKKH